ncbi:MAG TPA: sugar transferase [Gaiellaceae bacterium]|nr:sugar transferase [Gaiellaceae bacterium]
MELPRAHRPDPQESVHALPAPTAEQTDVRSATPAIFRGSHLAPAVRRLVSIAVLASLDAIGVTAGLFVSLVLREIYYGRTIDWGSLWQAEMDWLPFLILVTLLVFAQGDLYADRERRPATGRIVSSLLLVVLIALAFGLGTGHRFSTYGLAPTAFVLTAVLISLLRGAYDAITGRLLRRLGVRRRALLVGAGEHLTHLHEMLGRARRGIDYEFVGALAPEPDGIELPLLGDLKALPRVLATHRVDEVILADSEFGERQLLETVEQAHRRGVKVRIAPKTTELLVQRADYVPGQSVPLFEVHSPVFAGGEWVLKRTFDLVVSAVVLIAALPLWLLIAAAVTLTSPGPILYRDRRIGLGENEFDMLKFRTMYADAAEHQPYLERANEASGPLFKMRRDPRVTPVGQLLRRFSLDEVPQLLNVLRGQMSLVGPRPLPLRDYEQLEDWHRKRYNVLPGITGLWQISGRSNLSFDDLVRLDFYYLENWSLWMDISILVKTIPAVVGGAGAY